MEKNQGFQPDMAMFGAKKDDKRASKISDSKGEFMPTVALKPDALPSKGKAYPLNVEITYRPYVLGEVKKITDSKLNPKQAFDEILAGITITGMDAMELTVPDAMYLGLLRKISTLGAGEIKVTYQCGKCKHRGFHQFTLQDIEFQDMDAPQLPINADLEMGQVSFVPFNLDKFYKLATLGKESDDLAIFAMQVSNLDFETAYKKIYNASPADSQVLHEVDKALFHEMKPLTFNCSNKVNEETCGNKIEVELDGGDALLLPFRKQAESPRNKLSFGPRV